MPRLGPVLRDAWRLAAPYFGSEEKISAWALLLTTIALNLLLVGMTVILNFWNGAFYDAIQAKDSHSFFQLLLLGKTMAGFAFGYMPGFCLIAAVYIVVAVYATYINQWLYIRWRRWMTERMTGDWLRGRAYYHISLTARHDGTGTENPDQRIANDIDSFVSNTMSLLLDLISNVVTLLSYIAILWALSGPLTLWGITIPGYLIWVALIYSVFGSVITKWIGSPLVGLNFMQQRYEANFRFHLARMRENTEAVALYRGEGAEHAGLTSEFGNITGNWHQIMNRTKLLNSFTAGFNQVASIFPILVVAPRFFAGKILLGGITRTTDAFSQVQSAMSWFVSAFTTLASWGATIERLATFQRAIDAAHAAEGGFERVLGTSPAIDHATITLPDGTKLVENASLAFTPGRNVAIQGRSGSGKSTLFRALAGIWPFGSGQITAPAGKPLFLPQRPYFPLGTLRQAVAYPAEAGAFGDAELVQALNDVGLGALAGSLDDTATWSQRLSGGEQQRLAIARALLNKPEWLFLDEATSALDPESDRAIRAMLAAKLPGTTLIAISHDPIEADQRLILQNGQLAEA